MRIPAALFGAPLAAALIMIAGNATADGAASPSDLFREGERASAELAFDLALTRYEAVTAEAPSSPEAALAAARARYLRSHAEGRFAPLARLERTRRDPARASALTEIDALVRDAEAFPPGPVRVETWAFASEAYAERLGRADEARLLRVRILEDAHADDVLVAKAARDLVDEALARGDLGAARAALGRAGARATGDARQLVDRAARRGYVHDASIGAVGLAAVAAVAAIASAVRRGRGAGLARAVRGVSGAAVMFAAWVGGLGAVLARAYDGSDARPFLVFAVAVLPVLLLARASAASGSASRGARAGRAFVFAVAALGVAFLVLEGTDPRYLAGVGL